jgi:uncharacterized protein with HEPN domain
MRSDADRLVSEAARGVPEPVKRRHPEIAWQQIVALRNILVHEYFGIKVWIMM